MSTQGVMRPVYAHMLLAAEVALAQIPQGAFATRVPVAGVPESKDLAELTVEQLSRITVVAAARRAQPLSNTAVAAFDISDEDIRRSRATTLPEAPRLAPNLQVARADANQCAISARGFDNVLANKLLVMIDGRTVYSPLFSGVFWEAQQAMLEDAQRSEAISGPGETQGGLVAAGAGNREHGTSLRWDGRLGDRGHDTTLDARLGWHVSRRLERSITLRNLLGPGHVVETERAAFVKLMWRL